MIIHKHLTRLVSACLCMSLGSCTIIDPNPDATISGETTPVLEQTGKAI